MLPRKILVLSVSAGAGHVRAAEALCAAAVDPDHVLMRHINVMDVVPVSFRRLYIDGYMALVNHHPALWGALYHASDRAAPSATLQRMRRAIERLNT